jgi:L-ornithine N5-oxygenase
VLDACGLGEMTVSRNYRLNTPPEISAGCYLQGFSEETHGIADSLISVLAMRAGEIVTDLLEHQPPADPADAEREEPATTRA